MKNIFIILFLLLVSRETFGQLPIGKTIEQENEMFSGSMNGSEYVRVSRSNVYYKISNSSLLTWIQSTLITPAPLVNPPLIISSGKVTADTSTGNPHLATQYFVNHNFQLAGATAGGDLTGTYPNPTLEDHGYSFPFGGGANQTPFLDVLGSGIVDIVAYVPIQIDSTQLFNLHNYFKIKIDSIRRKSGTDSLFEYRDNVKTFAYMDSSGGSGSSITAGYGLSGTTTFITDTSIVVNKTGRQILSNKSLVGTNTFITDSIDNSKRLTFALNSMTTGKTVTISSAATNNRTFNIVDATSYSAQATSATTSQWFNAFNTDGTFTKAQPAFTDISGVGDTSQSNDVSRIVTDTVLGVLQKGHTDSVYFKGHISESQVTSLTSDLALKAPLASPTFTGTPAAPTASVGTNTTQLATTAYVDAAIPRGVYYTHSMAAGSVTSGLPSAYYYCAQNGGAVKVSGTAQNAGIIYFHYTSSLYPTMNGRSVNMFLEVALMTNNTAPSVNFTFNIFPVTVGTGTSTGTNPTLTTGSPVSNSTVTMNSPGSNSSVNGRSSAFSLVDNTDYAIGVNLSGTTATNSVENFTAIIKFYY